MNLRRLFSFFKSKSTPKPNENIKTVAIPLATTDIRLSELPALDRQILCNSLNERNVIWQMLATEMEFTAIDIQRIRRTQQQFNKTGPEVLLQIWGDQMNHTVSELFVILSKLQFYPAMISIQQHVDKDYLCLLLGTTWPDNIIDQVLVSEVLSPDPQEYAEIDNEAKILENINLATNGSDVVPDLDCCDCVLPNIAYADLKQATDNWNVNKILGFGAFGSVFAGNWKCGEVAIKRIEPNERDETNMHADHIVNELRFLSVCRHDNILSIYAYSMEDTFKSPACLVYELMEGGSVHKWLFDRLLVPEPLKWIDRQNIAFGTARGLQYLHSFGRRPIIHGDIKPANILLDAQLRPKIGDFGVAREALTGDIPMKETRLRGSRAYLPQEYTFHLLSSTKLDIFSFGVVMLQMATALRAHDNSYKFLWQFVLKYNDDMDHLLMDQEPKPERGETAIFKLLMRLGKKCTSVHANDRPTDMMQIIAKLQEGL